MTVANRRQRILAEELHRMIDRFRLEFRVTHTDVIGVLELVKQDLLNEIYWMGQIEDDDGNEPGKEPNNAP